MKRGERTNEVREKRERGNNEREEIKENEPCMTGKKINNIAY
jgi:hypothetical protein